MSLDLRSSWLRNVIYPVSDVHTTLAAFAMLLCVQPCATMNILMHTVRPGACKGKERSTAVYPNSAAAVRGQILPYLGILWSAASWPAGRFLLLVSLFTSRLWPICTSTITRRTQRAADFVWM